MMDPEQSPEAVFDQTEGTVAVRGTIPVGSTSANECRLTAYDHDPPEQKLTVAVAEVSKQPYIPDLFKTMTADVGIYEYALSARFSDELPKTVLVKEKHAGRDEVVETVIERT